MMSAATVPVALVEALDEEVTRDSGKAYPDAVVELREKAKADASFANRRHRVRHYVTNLVLEVDVERARQTSYWVGFNNAEAACRP